MEHVVLRSSIENSGSVDPLPTTEDRRLFQRARFGLVIVECPSEQSTHGNLQYLYWLSNPISDDGDLPKAANHDDRDDLEDDP